MTEQEQEAYWRELEAWDRKMKVFIPVFFGGGFILLIVLSAIYMVIKRSLP